jgi:type IV secretory pathway component VirB8
MFAITSHLEQAENHARQHRNVAVALVVLAGFGAILSGLLINAMTSLNPFANFVPV